MQRPRVIPCLLLKNRGLVKTMKFRDPVYLGDPINVVKIFNDKEVDEILFLDINVTPNNKALDWDTLQKISEEAFVPVGYGGGVRKIEDVKRIIALGFEKICVNSYAVENPAFVSRAADAIGSQSVVVSIDVKKNIFGKYKIVTHGGKVTAPFDLVEWARQMELRGAGEIFLNSVDRDGTMKGYDTDLIKLVSREVGVPVVACGGAGNISEFLRGTEAGASAVSAGSYFVFQGPHRAVLISYPSQKELKSVFHK